MEATFSFTGKLFEAAAEAAWVFVSVPVHDAEEIRDLVPHRPGFGSIRVGARIGSTEWETSIFPSKESRSFVLPIRRSVRRQEEIDTGDVVHVAISINLD